MITIWANRVAPEKPEISTGLLPFVFGECLGESIMMPLRDLKGKKFGRLFVVSRTQSEDKKPRWLCRCDCGVEKIIRGSDLNSGRTRSCGCLKTERIIAQSYRHGHAERTKKTRIYRIWMAMNNRCNNPNNLDYKYYGGRGITICKHWNKFENFLLDMGEAPKGLTIDRIDNNGNYEPSNCKWSTRKEQANNRNIKGLLSL